MKAAVAFLALFLIFNQPDPRQHLIDLIFGGVLPSRQPDLIERNIIDPAWIGTPNLTRIDRITVRMDFSLTSVIYHFIPLAANGELFIWHGGHGQGFEGGRDFIGDALGRGYSVAAVAMPLSPGNSTPSVEIDGHLWLIESHSQMQFLRPAAGHPFRYFFEPVIVFLNYAAPNYSRISMTGISGGGWTTTWVAALDSRIENSYPVAGSLPLWVRDQTDFGDWEQHTAEIYSQISYEDLYVLGASNGRQLQILNRYDPCCFAGLRWMAYYDDVRARSVERWDLWMDETSRVHGISPAARAVILGDAPPVQVWRVWLPVVSR